MKRLLARFEQSPCSSSNQVSVGAEASRSRGRPEHWPHRQEHHRNSQQQTDPEAARHVAQLPLISGFGRNLFRFQGHAAQGAGSGPLLLHLRVLRAGVEGLRRRSRCLRSGRLRVQVVFRIGDKLLPGLARAEGLGFLLPLGHTTIRL